MKTEKLSLRGKLFEDAVQSADTAMSILIAKMKHRGATEGKMTLTISLELDPEEIIDPTTGRPEEINRVEVSYKATYSVPDRDSIQGNIINKNAAVIQMSDGAHYAEIGDEQESLF